MNVSMNATNMNITSQFNVSVNNNSSIYMRQEQYEQHQHKFNFNTTVKCVNECCICIDYLFVKIT